MLTKAALAFAAATLALGPCSLTGLKPPKDLAGTWGGENAALMVDDTSAHIHIGCTYGNIHQQLIPHADGRFDFPGEHNINNSLKTFIDEGGKVYCCRFGLSLHGAREEDLIEGVIPTHPLDVQDALIHYKRKGAIINSTYMF